MWYFLEHSIAIISGTLWIGSDPSEVMWKLHPSYIWGSRFYDMLWLLHCRNHCWTPPTPPSLKPILPALRGDYSIDTRQKEVNPMSYIVSLTQLHNLIQTIMKWSSHPLHSFIHPPASHSLHSLVCQYRTAESEGREVARKERALQEDWVCRASQNTREIQC